MAADIFLIVGCTGAGKTTYARALADQLGAVRFSIDEWMTALFWADSPQPIQFQWTMERVERCEAQIFAMARQLATRGIPAVLDLGFTRKQHRDKFFALAAEAGLSAVIHFLDVPADERWQRVNRRNNERGETYAMTVDRQMFDFMEGLWEPPLEAEWSAGGGRRIDSATQVRGVTLVVPRHAVLTGAPGAGKTTLLGAAAAAGILTSPEVARELLKTAGGMELRASDPLGFAEAMLEAHFREFERHAAASGLVLFDRGFPDVVGFLDVSGLAVPKGVDKVCRELRYHGPILRAPAWAAIYVQDAQRIQDWEQAVASDKAVTAAWKRYGYAVTDLPLVGVEERLAFLHELVSG